MSSSLLVAGLTILTILISLYMSTRRLPFPTNAPKLHPNQWPIVGAVQFFTARWDFFDRYRPREHSGNFSFYLGRHRVVGLIGEDGRRTFYESRALSLSEGYAVLFGQNPGPRPRDDKYLGLDMSAKDHSDDGDDDDTSTHDQQPDFERWFATRISKVLSSDSLTKSLPKILSDTTATLNSLTPPAGTRIAQTDPFTTLAPLIFRNTLRTTSTHALADSSALLHRIHAQYTLIEQSTTPLTLLTPWWLPTPARVKALYAGLRLFLLIRGTVTERKRSRKRSADDAIQTLLDRGDPPGKIAGFAIAGLYAGTLNTRVVAAYLLCHLAASPHWLARVEREVAAAARPRHRGRASAKTEPEPEPEPLPQETLANLPLSTWDSDTTFPALALCLRETIRVACLGAMFRRNRSGADVPIGRAGEVIPADCFAAYHVADVHYDPRLYPEPGRWDPGRYVGGRAPARDEGGLGWVGWGAGGHVCPGMRLAKLEVNIVTALFLCKFRNLSLYDDEGVKLDDVPPPDRNMTAPERPKRGLRLRYEVRERGDGLF